MWMESDGIKGHGSIFWFTARFKVPPSYAIPFSPWANMFKGFYALVVDDNESNRVILIDMLKVLFISSFECCIGIQLLTCKLYPCLKFKSSCRCCS